MLNPSERLERGIVTRSIRVTDQGRGIDILDARRRRLYSVRANRDIAIASCHPHGIGAALVLGGGPSLAFGEEVTIDTSPDGAVLSGPDSVLRLQFDPQRVVLFLPDGSYVARFVRNLQLKVVTEQGDAGGFSVPHTPYSNPVDEGSRVSGITMSGPVAFPFNAAASSLARFSRLAAIGAVAAQVAASAHSGDTPLRPGAIDEDLAAALGDAAVIAAVLRSASEMGEWLG